MSILAHFRRASSLTTAVRSGRRPASGTTACAAIGEIGLAVLLVIGFALHNATEGSGIVAPLAAEADRLVCGFLLMLGLIGGAPTFLGTAVGHPLRGPPTGRARARGGRTAIPYSGVFVGLALGFVTDMIVTAGGA